MTKSSCFKFPKNGHSQSRDDLIIYYLSPLYLGKQYYGNNRFTKKL